MNGRTVQGELPLAVRGCRRTQEQRAQDVADFEALVAGQSGITRRELCARRPDWNDRYVGKMAEHSLRVLSFPGSDGYRLISVASSEELAHAVAAIDEQVEKMHAKRIRFGNILGLRHASQSLGDMQLAADFANEFFKR